MQDEVTRHLDPPLIIDPGILPRAGMRGPSPQTHHRYESSGGPCLFLPSGRGGKQRVSSPMGRTNHSAQKPLGWGHSRRQTGTTKRMPLRPGSHAGG